jgi:uncharacterized protein (UPF0332 family)
LTEDNKKENIREELVRAAGAIQAANLLFDNSFLNDAVSRLYYFLLFNMRALLLSRGFQPKSHEGILRLFGLHFVKEGFFAAQDSHLFARLMKYREEADYNPSYTFTREDFVGFRKEAEALSGKIHEYLQEKGYIA